MLPCADVKNNVNKGNFDDVVRLPWISYVVENLDFLEAHLKKYFGPIGLPHRSLGI
jgi:hypothetical protein